VLTQLKKKKIPARSGVGTNLTKEKENSSTIGSECLPDKEKELQHSSEWVLTRQKRERKRERERERENFSVIGSKGSPKKEKNNFITVGSGFSLN